MKTRFLLFSLIAAAALAGCTTPQYDLAREQCRRDAATKFPPNLQNKVVQNSRLVEVPDGTSSCTTTQERNQMYTTCRQGTKYVRDYYNETIVVDLNERQRDQFINNCTVRFCINRYGNPQCEPAELKSTGSKNSSTNPKMNSQNAVKWTLTSREKMEDGKWKCTYRNSLYEYFSFTPIISCPLVLK